MVEMTDKNKYKVSVTEDAEIRDGFEISSNRKKIWNIQLLLFEELKRICKKHNIKYYAEGGTLLGAIRHKGYIPWDDDFDVAMFRDDYEKFIKIAPSEMPNHIEFWEMYHGGFSKFVDTKTSAFTLEDNWWDKNYKGGIRIDIFPIDSASKYQRINWIKNMLMYFFRMILHARRSDLFYSEMIRWKKFFVYLLKGVSYSKLYKIHDYISKKVFFKGTKSYDAIFPNRFFPTLVFNNAYDIKFENTTICIPSGYDEWLKIAYGDYIKPVIFPGGHNCWYSVDKSFKEIIKGFDRKKSNEENYKNCKDLFVL